MSSNLNIRKKTTRRFLAVGLCFEQIMIGHWESIFMLSAYRTRHRVITVITTGGRGGPVLLRQRSTRNGAMTFAHSAGYVDDVARGRGVAKESVRRSTSSGQTCRAETKGNGRQADDKYTVDCYGHFRFK